jgi:hypothetical protein
MTMKMTMNDVYLARVARLRREASARELAARRRAAGYKPGKGLVRLRLRGPSTPRAWPEPSPFHVRIMG